MRKKVSFSGIRQLNLATECTISPHITYRIDIDESSEIGQFPWKIGLLKINIEEVVWYTKLFFQELYGNIFRKRFLINLLNKVGQFLGKDWTIFENFGQFSKKSADIFEKFGQIREKNRTNFQGKL